MSPIEKELTSALKITPADGETRSKFLKRIAAAAGEIPDTEFAALSEPAQTWQAAAATAANKKKKPVDFPDADADEVAKRFPEPANTKAEKPAKKAKGDTVKSEKAEKPAKTAKKAAKGEKPAKAPKTAKEVPPAPKPAKGEKSKQGGKREGQGRRQRGDSATTQLAAYLLSSKCASRADLRAYADENGVSMADSSLGALWHYGSAVAAAARKKFEKKA